VASRVMRRILVDHARSCKSLKRGGPLRPVRLDEAFQYATERSLELLALDDALDQLAKLSPRQSRGLEFVHFRAGLFYRHTEGHGLRRLETSRSMPNIIDRPT
jgi:hypothetical protein